MHTVILFLFNAHGVFKRLNIRNSTLHIYYVMTTAVHTNWIALWPMLRKERSLTFRWKKYTNHLFTFAFIAKCSSHLSYQGQTFAVSCIWILTLAKYMFFVVKLTFETLTVRGQQHSLSTNGYSFGSVEVLQTENVSTWGGLEPPNLESPLLFMSTTYLNINLLQKPNESALVTWACCH